MPSKHSSKWRRRYDIGNTRLTIKRMHGWRLMVRWGGWFCTQIGPWYFEVFKSSWAAEQMALRDEQAASVPASVPVPCFWRALPVLGFPPESCKHPWAPGGCGAECSYIGREDECPTKQHGLIEEGGANEHRTDGQSDPTD